MIIKPAYLWDGNKQLVGELSVTAEGLQFYFHDFMNSRLNLFIPLGEIQKLEIFKLYNIAAHGLKVTDNHNKEDLFIIDKPVEVKRRIEELIDQNKGL